MVWFSDIQEIFNPFGISLITTPSCILCTAKLKHFIPLLRNFSHSRYCYYLGQKSIHVTDYLSLVINSCHTSFLFYTNIYTHMPLRA